MIYTVEGLHVLTDRELAKPQPLIEIIEQAMIGGASVIQLRDKNVDDNTMIPLGSVLIQLLKGKIPLIVNDRVHVALVIGAQGVHVGQKDMSAREVRRLIGKDMILGVSANTVEEAIKAEQDGADYIGAGPVFLTSTKPDADPVIGIEGLTQIKKAVSIPVVAIGGINIINAESVVNIADGIAVISAVMAADDPFQATKQLVKIINKY